MLSTIERLLEMMEGMKELWIRDICLNIMNCMSIAMLGEIEECECSSHIPECISSECWRSDDRKCADYIRLPLTMIIPSLESLESPE